MTDLFRLFPDLSALPADVQRQMGELKPMQVPKGTVLFRDGDVCQGYVLLLSGCVRVQKMDPEGREIVLYRVENGQTCMLTTSCLLAGKSYPAEGIAEEETEFVMMPAHLFNELLADATFRRFVLGMISERIADLMALIEDVAFGRMDVRLARRLLELGKESGTLSLTHQQLASELGTAREVVSRLLKDFERKGWLQLRRGEVQISDAGALQQLASERL